MHKINILLVEDSSTYNRTMSLLLQSYGYEVDEALTCAHAHKFINEKQFDFILLDLGLPDCESDEFIDSIKSKSEAKIIVLSSQTDIQRRNYLFEQGGVIDYFSKVTPFKQLVSDINNVIKSIYENASSTILVVDDSSFVRKSIKQALSLKNYNVLVAKDPLEAFDKLEVSSVDLILSDLEMPHMTGVDFTAKIKNDKRYKDIPVLILSSSDSSEAYSRVLKHGAVDFIKKPFLVEEIILKCDIHIKQSHLIKKVSSYQKYIHEYQRILDESNIVSKADLKGNITYVNQKFLDISGYEKNELIGKSHNVIRHQDVPKETFQNLWQKIQNKETFKGIIKNKRKDGTPYYVDASVLPIIDVDGNVTEYIGVRHDITDIMNAKKLFQDDISHTKEPLAFLSKIENYVMLKEFYGEAFIQKVEDYVSTQLISLMPPYYNIKKVYHLDNGEYGFFKELEDTILDDVPIFLRNFQENLSSHNFMVDGTKMDINLSFAYTTQKEDAFENLKIGVYKAQQEKLGIIFSNQFAAKNKTKAKNNLAIVDILKEVIENDPSKIVSYFQPVYNNHTKEVEKYESLVRLFKDNETIILPFFFLDIAKRAGYYLDVTNIILDNTFKALDKTDKEITINLSTLDIESAAVRNQILSLIADPKYYGRVVFELLEDEAAKDFKTIQDFISIVKVVGGVKIAIDDFGAGYSNFERLLDFQPDILKIDGSLIKNIVNDSFSEHVVESIVLFAKKQNIQTVAEFVSDEKILKKVTELGIDYSQGYHLGKPDLLENQK